MRLPLRILFAAQASSSEHGDRSASDRRQYMRMSAVHIIDIDQFIGVIKLAHAAGSRQVSLRGSTLPGV